MKLHIGNLPKTATEAELSDVLTAFAKPTSLEIIKDQSGVSKGFGFAEFASDDDARAVIAGVNGKDLGGNELRLGEARPRKADTRA
ncbi:MAG TPA: RNA-binding protein [Thermoanaerobaculia bacterium]|jgi:RNA recognition motif-containing protein